MKIVLFYVGVFGMAFCSWWLVAAIVVPPIINRQLTSFETKIDFVFAFLFAIIYTIIVRHKVQTRERSAQAKGKGAAIEIADDGR